MSFRAIRLWGLWSTLANAQTHSTPLAFDTMDFFAVLPRPRIDLTAPEKATLLGLSFVTLTGNLIPTRTGTLRSHDDTLTQDDLACISADTMPVGRLFHRSTIPGMSYQPQPTADTFDESETPTFDQIAQYLKLPETWTVLPETNEVDDGPTLGPLILRTPEIRKTVFTDPDGNHYKHLSGLTISLNDEGKIAEPGAFSVWCGDASDNAATKRERQNTVIKLRHAFNEKLKLEAETSGAAELETHLKAQEWNSALSAWNTMAERSLEAVSRNLDLWQTHEVTSGLWSKELASLNVVLAFP